MPILSLVQIESNRRGLGLAIWTGSSYLCLLQKYAGSTVYDISACLFICVCYCDLLYC